MIDFEDGSSRLVWLNEVSPLVWQRTLTLEPGEYRFCYYVDDGCTTTFHLPSHCEVDGLKAVLRVPGSTIKSSAGVLREQSWEVATAESRRI